jgi:hypothetical protein
VGTGPGVRDGGFDRRIGLGGRVTARIAGPLPWRSLLEEAHAGATASNALLLVDAAEAQATLASAGIESVALKGTGLVAVHYPDIGARHVGDVDLLVSEDDAPHAEEVLRAAGAFETSPIIRYDGTERRPGQRLPREEVRLTTPSGVLVDIQDRVPGGVSDGSDVSGVLRRARRIAWQGRVLRIPSVPDLGAGACLHVFAHHGGAAPFIHRHLADLAVLVGSGAVTWDEIDKCMPGRSGRAALVLSRALLDHGSTAGAGWLLNSLEVRYRNWTSAFRFRRRTGTGGIRILFPARTYMAARYGVPVTAPWLPLLYLWRPIRGVWSTVTGR